MASLPHRPAAFRSPIQPAQPPRPVEVKAWANDAAEALRTVHVTPMRGTSVTIAIPLDEETVSPPRVKKTPRAQVDESEEATLRRRDSLKRREALLKGKEGSRRRQRWENDRLLSNPHYAPPLPSDWEVHPTYQRHSVPYFLAPLWDASENQRRALEQAARASKAGKPRMAESAAASAGVIPKELRDRIKRTRAARGLLQDLEDRVREFVVEWEVKQKKAEIRERKKAERKAEKEAEGDDMDTADKDMVANSDSEEEIVFVGRDGTMRDMPPSPSASAKSPPTSHRPNRHRVLSLSSDLGVSAFSSDEEMDGLRMEKLVFDAAVEDRGAAFARWLVHEVAKYYGLRTWSVTRQGRREAYVGFDGKEAEKGKAMGELPVPLWGMV